MKVKSVLFIYSLFTVACLHAAARPISQENQNRKSLLQDARHHHIDTVGRETVFSKVDVEASYQGGVEAWIHFVQKNLNAQVPVRNGAPAGQYTVVVQFIVDSEGQISDIKALTSHSYGMEQEVMRVIGLSSTWEPARIDNQTVKAYRKQPITFVVEEVQGKKKRKFL
mgnify:FL=1